MWPQSLIKPHVQSRLNTQKHTHLLLPKKMHVNFAFYKTARKYDKNLNTSRSIVWSSNSSVLEGSALMSSSYDLVFYNVIVWVIFTTNVTELFVHYEHSQYTSYKKIMQKQNTTENRRQQNCRIWYQDFNRWYCACSAFTVLVGR